MMKKINYLILFIVLSFTMNVCALKSSDANLKNRNVCEKIELAKANKDDGVEKVECFNNYADAKKKMNEMEDDSLIILERSNNVTKVIDAKYALVYLDRGDVLTYLYTTNSLKNTSTYMNNSANYGATDGAFIELNYSNKAAKIKIGGATGWVKNGEYTLIPINWVKSSSYYKIDNSVSHVYAKNIENSGYTQMSRTLGPNNDIPEGNYKSYDGIYFYSDFISMLDDYKENKHERSINKDSAYYNYYLYLPHRSKTNYDIDDLDSYIRNVLNFKGSIYGKLNTNGYSVIYGTAEYFMFNEKMYGANAISVFSLSRNESANGRSSIAINKNNIFGHNAVDGAAYSSATGYLDVRSSIYTHGYGYINYGYARVSDSRYHGTHFGNKDTGMNVMYASDVFWGEKAANYYYSFDKDNGMLDYNFYQLIISNTGDVNARNMPNTGSKIVYSIKTKNLPFILLEEVEGSEVNGNKIWYKIQADSNIDNNGNLIGSNSSTWPEYNWNGAVYVHSSYFTKINHVESKDGKYPNPNSVLKDYSQSKILTYANKTSYTPIVGQANSDIETYYSSTLTEKVGTIKKDSLVVILEKIEGDDVKYHIITDFGTNQKAWIKGENVNILNKDLLSVNITNAGGYIDITDVPGGKSVLKVYHGNFLPIVGREIKNDKTYLKVEYQINNKIMYGYVDGSISNISYTLNYLNSEPIIEANDTTIILNNTFNPMENVYGNDLEDGDITNKIKVIKNTVDTKKTGTYEVTYSLTDSFGDTVTKTINVSVIKLEVSDALFMYDGLKHVSDNTFTFSGFMGIKGMNNKDVTTTLIFENELTKEEVVYKLSKWQDYPYEMSSLDDKENYDYSGGWFKDDLDLTDLPIGDYRVYVKTINGNKEAKALFTNIAYLDMARRIKGKNKEFAIDVDYTTLNSPLIFKVRNNLISLDIPKTYDPMYNFFNEISLNNNELKIKGTSHNVGVSLGIKDDVKRSIVFENKDTFEIIEMDLGSITNGDYPISLAVSDNCDKTRAWYSNTVDLSKLNSGNYTIYIKNVVNGIAYYGELIDVSYTDFTNINNKQYFLSRNDDIRLRMELKVVKN